MPTAVTAIAPAPSDLAREHFAAGLTFETDCWDVHDALSRGADFVLLDVRSPALYARGHVPGAVNLPHGKIIGSRMQAWPQGTVFVTYCAGRALQRRRPGRAAAGPAQPSGEDHGRGHHRLARRRLRTGSGRGAVTITIRAA